MRTVNADSESIDALFDLFSDERRRDLCLHVVRSEKTTFSLEELVDRMSERDSKAGSEAGRTRVAAELHHVHLPRLDDAGLVEYDTETGTIRCEDCAMADLCEAFDRDGAMSELRTGGSG